MGNSDNKKQKKIKKINKLRKKNRVDFKRGWILIVYQTKQFKVVICKYTKKELNLKKCK